MAVPKWQFRLRFEESTAVRAHTLRSATSSRLRFERLRFDRFEMDPNLVSEIRPAGARQELIESSTPLCGRPRNSNGLPRSAGRSAGVRPAPV